MRRVPIKIERGGNLPDVCLITSDVFNDERGWFYELYKETEMKNLGLDLRFKQINRSLSKKIGTIRGLHLQEEPFAQGKLVSCIRGSIFDVAVDIRPESETFGSWVSFQLEGADGSSVWVPEGFAHGFQTLSENTEVLYLTTKEYAPDYESSIAWDDSDIGIEWPIESPILSEKDKLAGKLEEIVRG